MAYTCCWSSRVKHGLHPQVHVGISGGVTGCMVCGHLTWGKTYNIWNIWIKRFNFGQVCLCKSQGDHYDVHYSRSNMLDPVLYSSTVFQYSIPVQPNKGISICLGPKYWWSLHCSKLTMKESTLFTHICGHYKCLIQTWNVVLGVFYQCLSASRVSQCGFPTARQHSMQ